VLPVTNVPIINPLVVAGGAKVVVRAQALQLVGTKAAIVEGKTMFISPPAGRASSRLKYRYSLVVAPKFG